MPDAKPDWIREVDVLIVGAGFSGICMAIRLRRSGNNSFLVLEKAASIGGTWRDNTYPGCACDIASHLYSLSFAPKTDWSRVYPTQPEIWAYLSDLVERENLTPQILCNTAMTQADWDEPSRRWIVRTAAGQVLVTRVLISAVGALHHPGYPSIEGRDSFAGRAFHSAEWDHDRDLTGRRVAVIGTGASSIQFVPQIAAQVDHLSVFQRTPAWILPKADKPISRKARQRIERWPLYRRLMRGRLYWSNEMLVRGFIDPRHMDGPTRLAIRHLERQVADPVLRASLLPTYTLGCKRALISNDYYPALQRPNVELVTTPIDRIVPQGVTTQDGCLYEADTIIYATGFRLADRFKSIRMTGQSGRTLEDARQDGVEAYYGISVAGFPNFFSLLGPNTGVGHNSVLLMVEAQVGYILDLLARMRAAGAVAAAVRPEVQQAFNERLRARLNMTVWQTGGCTSWYQDDQGRNMALWPASTVEYIIRTRRATIADYELYSPAAVTLPA